MSTLRPNNIFMLLLALVTVNLDWPLLPDTWLTWRPIQFLKEMKNQIKASFKS
jgi:hypothetical protein